MSSMRSRDGRKRWALWPWLGAVIGVLALLWALRNFDVERLRQVLATADYRLLLPLPALVALEQLVRAIKWRQFLHPLRAVGIRRLFAAIMIGYLANHLAPVRVSPLVRAWIVARLEAMRVGTVLASIVLERIVDGFVFVGFTVAAIAFVTFPDESGAVGRGLAWGGAGSLAAFSVLLAGLFYLRRIAAKGSVLPGAILRWLPERLGRGLDAFSVLFAGGVAFPRESWRQLTIIAASIVMKLIAVMYLVLAGLAFNVLLTPMQYVFAMVFLWFLVILAGMLRIVGSFAVGTVYVLGGFGVGVETALAMAIVVQTASFLTLVVTGAVALWTEGLSLSEVRARKAPETAAPETMTEDTE